MFKWQKASLNVKYFYSFILLSFIVSNKYRYCFRNKKIRILEIDYLFKRRTDLYIFNQDRQYIYHYENVFSLSS